MVREKAVAGKESVVTKPAAQADKILKEAEVERTIDVNDEPITAFAYHSRTMLSR